MDKELQQIIQRMIDAGESHESISSVIAEYNQKKNLGGNASVNAASKVGDISSLTKSQSVKENNYSFSNIVNAGKPKIEDVVPQKEQKDDFNPQDFLLDDINKNKGHINSHLETGVALAGYHQARNKQLDEEENIITQQRLNYQQDKNVIQGDMLLPKLAINPAFKKDEDVELKKIDNKIGEIQTYKKKLNQSIGHAASIYAASKTNNPVEAGRIVRSITGDPSVQQELNYEEKGLPISDAQKFYNEKTGLDALEAGLDASHEDKTSPEYTFNKSLIEQQRKTILDRHPEFKRHQIANAIAQQIIKDDKNANRSNLWFTVPKAAKELGLSEDEVTAIDFDDIPIQGFVDKTIGGAYNAILGIGAGAARIGGSLIGVDKDKLSNFIEGATVPAERRYEDIRGVQGSPEIVDTDPHSKTFLQNIPNPNKGKYNYTFAAVSNAIGNGIGSLYGGFVLPAKMIGMKPTMVLGNYENNYQESKNIIGDAPQDEGKRHLMSLLKGVIDYEVFKPLNKLITPEETRELGGIIKNAASLKNINKEALTGWVQKVLKGVENTAVETGKIGVAQIGGEYAKNIVDHALGSVQGAKESDSQLEEKIVHGIHDLPFSMAIPLGLGEFVKGVRHSSMFRENIYNAGLHPETYKAELPKLVDEGHITQEQAQQRAEVIDVMAKVIESIPTEVELNHNQKVEFALSKVKEIALTSKAQNVEDAGLAKFYMDKVSEEINNRANILNGDKKENEFISEEKPSSNTSEEVLHQNKPAGAADEAAPILGEEKGVIPLQMKDDNVVVNQSKDVVDLGNEMKQAENAKAEQTLRDNANDENNKQQAESEKTKPAIISPTEVKEIQGHEIVPPIKPVVEPPKPEVVENEGDDGKRWTAIRKKKQMAEIKAVADAYKAQKVKGWNESMRTGLEKTAEMHPDKTLPDAALSLMRKIREGEGHGDLTKDEALATMQYLKHEIGGKRAKLSEVVNSDNELDRLAAIAQDDVLEKDYVDTALTIKDITTEAGRTLAYAQSELSDGLQIRRMQLMKAKGGEKLSEEDMKWTEKMWEKEKALIEKEHELREKGMQEEFDKKIADLQRQYENKAKQQQAAKSFKDKTLSQKGKDIADKIRKLKTDKDNLNIDFSLGTWNLAVEGIAKLVEGGATIAEAIEQLIKDKTVAFKNDDERKKFESQFVGSIGRQIQRETAIDKIQELTQDGIVTDITPHMVSKNLIRDFVDSHIGSVEQKNVLDAAHKELQKVLPDVTKEKLAEAYIKQGEYKLPTKGQLETSIRKQQEQLKRIAKKELTADQQQQIKLQTEKENAKRQKAEFQRKIDEGEYEEKPAITLKHTDAELIKLNKEKADIEGEYRKKQHEVQEKSKHLVESVADFLRTSYVASLIGSPVTLAKIGAMSVTRPMSEAITKLTFGKVFDVFFPNISKAARRGGESSSWRSVENGFKAYFRQMGEKGMQKLIDKSNKAYEEAKSKYEDYKNTPDADKSKVEQLKNDADKKLLGATGNLVYQFIGGSSIKDAVQAFMFRANNIESQFGAVNKESIKGFGYDKNQSVGKQVISSELHELSYILSFVGRSHSALKTFSGRFSFAAGFMARLEAAVKDGADISNSDKVLEIAHESYLDWERGKYQQSNFITEAWNNLVKGADSKFTKHPEWNKYNKAAQALLRMDVAITRVPVNIIHEQVMEYTIGAFRAVRMANKAYKKAVGDVKSEIPDVDTPEFKEKVKEIISNMDEKQAATIARCFRKGSMGIGLYAFALISGLIHFGIFPHLGQKKKKKEDELAADELNPGQVQIGDAKLGETASKVIEHTPALWPMFMGLGMAQAYNDNIKKGKSNLASISDAAYQHLKVIESNIPQTKIVSPTQLGVDVKRAFTKRLDDWGLIDDSPEGYNKDDMKDPIFKPFVDKEIPLPKEVPTMVIIKDDKAGVERKLPDYGRDKIKEYEEVRKKYLKLNLADIQKSKLYVDKYGNISTKKAHDKTEKLFKDLNAEQLKDVLKIAATKATIQTKDELFYNKK